MFRSGSYLIFVYYQSLDVTYLQEQIGSQIESYDITSFGEFFDLSEPFWRNSLKRYYSIFNLRSYLILKIC